jgi:group I intron endonuclease
VIGIYKIENLINHKVYIGQSKDILLRWKSHKNSIFVDFLKIKNHHLYKSFRKYGIKNFSFEIVKKCKKEDLNDLESFFIRVYASWHRNYGYNKTFGGGQNFYLTPESRKKVLLKLKMLF